MLTVASYGGGLNSTAMLIGCVERGIKVDLILFADTGAERPDTYCYIGRFSEWLESKGYPKIQTVHKVYQDGSRDTLPERCMKEQMLPSIAYGYKKCSQRYKIAPQDKFVNNWTPAKEAWKNGEKVTKLIGYDADEPHRVKKLYDDDKYEYSHLLVDWGWGRDACKEAVERVGLPVPGKSSCYICSSMTKGEIRRLDHEYPELMKEAIAIERNANLTKIPGLGRKFAWEKFLEQGDLFPDDFPEPYIDVACGCYDG